MVIESGGEESRNITTIDAIGATGTISPGSRNESSAIKATYRTDEIESIPERTAP